MDTAYPRMGDFGGACTACRGPRLWVYVPPEAMPDDRERGPGVARCMRCGIDDTAFPGVVQRLTAAVEAELRAEYAAGITDPLDLTVSAPARPDLHTRVAPTTPPTPTKTTTTTRTPRMAPTKPNTRTHVTRVTGTLKAGAIDVTLGDKTLILGANGTGKTTIINALTLALFGLAQDVAGRDAETRDGDLYRHLAHGTDDLIADVTLSDGRAFFFHKPHGKEAEVAHLPKAQHEAALPLASLRDAFTGSAPTVRKWALNAAGRWITVDTLRAAIANANATGALVVPVKVDDPIAWLETQRDNADKSKRAAAAAKRDADAQIKALAPGAGLPVGDAELAAARLAAEDAAVVQRTGVTQAEHDAFVAEVARLEQSKVAAEAKLGATTAPLVEAQSAVDTLRAYLDTVPPAPTLDMGTRNVLAGLAAFLPAHKANFNGSCVVCGTQHADHAAYGARLDALLAQATAALNPPDPAAEHRGNYAAWQAELARRQSLHRQADGDKLQAVNAWMRAKEKLLVPVVQADNAAGVAARAAYDDLVRRHTLHAEIQRHRASVTRAAEDEAKSVTVLDATKAIREVLTNGALSMLEQEVSKYLPTGETFHVDLGSSYARIGFVRDGVFRSAMSGAEEARVYAAVAAALATANMTLVIPAERQWSAETLREVMRALANAPCQVILVSTVAPAGKVAGKVWTVVRTDSDGGRGDDGDGGEPVVPAPVAAPVVPVVPVVNLAGDLVAEQAPPLVLPPSLASLLPLPADETPADPPEPHLTTSAAAPSPAPSREAPAWLPTPSIQPTARGTNSELPPLWDGDVPDVADVWFTPGGASYTRYKDGAVVRVGVSGETLGWPASA